MVRFVDDGGEEPLAPVIPLFGVAGGRPSREDARRTAPAEQAMRDRASHSPVVEREKRDDAGSVGAPEPTWHPVWRAEADDAPLDESSAGVPTADEPTRPIASTTVAEAAEKSLLRKLHGRSLSESEAQTLLRAAGVEPEQGAAIVSAFRDRGYLDDAALAEQLVHVGVDRRGSGRRLIAQTLAKRGIPRDIADAALMALPDDDAERALDFARTKARSLVTLDHEVALRRLTGQLARRGYPGSVALAAAKQALAEESGPATSVRFR